MFRENLKVSVYSKKKLELNLHNDSLLTKNCTLKKRCSSVDEGFTHQYEGNLKKDVTLVF